MGSTLADSDNREFVVIYNRRKISAGEAYEFPISYATTDKTWDYTDLAASDECKIKAEVTTWDTSDANQTHITISDEATGPEVYIDTTAKLDTTTKSLESGSGSPFISASNLSSYGFTGTYNDNDYYYSVWSVTSKVTNVTQKYNFSLVDGKEWDSDNNTATNNVADNLELKNSDGTESVQGEVVDISYNSKLGNANLTVSGSRVDYVLTRYSKSDVDNLPIGRYTAENTVTAVVDPADRKDNDTGKTDNAVLIYEKKAPNYYAPTENYDAEKYGIYDGNKHVTNTYNISSYSLNNIENDADVTGLKYEITAEAYAYPKTVANIENEIREMTIETTGTTTKITAGNDTYVFDSDSPTYYTKNGNMVDFGDGLSHTADDVKKIAAEGLAAQYAQKDVLYTLSDKDIVLTDAYDESVSDNHTKLVSGDDYEFTALDFTYSAMSVVYDSDKMEFVVSDVTSFASDDKINIYVYLNGSDSRVLAATYDLSTGTYTYTNAAYVKSVSGMNVEFVSGANVTGYDIETQNRYFNVELTATPTLTLKASSNVKNHVDEKTTENNDSKKIGVNNTAKWIVKPVGDNDHAIDKSISGTDYVASVTGSSSISKKTLDKKTSITGRDGNTYVTGNDTVKNQYIQTWSITMNEKETDESGTHNKTQTHDDLQDYGTLALNSVAYQTGNSEIWDGRADGEGKGKISSYSYMRGFADSGDTSKRFIFAEASKQIHALIQTSSGIYKKVATVDNPALSKDGVVHESEDYKYNIRMRNSGTAKSQDIVILDSIEDFQNGRNYSSKDCDWQGSLKEFDFSGLVEKGIAPKLYVYMGDDDVDFEYVESGDAYTKTLNGTVYTDNYHVRSEDYSERHVRTDKLNNILAGNGEQYGWTTISDWKTLDGKDASKIKAFIVDLSTKSTGDDFILGKGESISFNVIMTAPDKVSSGKSNGDYEALPKTYNNVYRSFTNVTPINGDENNTESVYYYTHYDYTTVVYKTEGTLKFRKVDSKTGEGLEGVKFSLSGTSAYGTDYNETLTSDSNGYVQFEHLEKGDDYTLIEEYYTDDYVYKPVTHTVKVDTTGGVKIYVDGNLLDDDGTDFLIKNTPRIRGNLKFIKTDAHTGKGISGATFTLTGTSSYAGDIGTITVTSDSEGNVLFEGIDVGDYTLTETEYPDGYEKKTKNTYAVTVKDVNNKAVISITGSSKNSSGDVVIKNTPYASITVLKADSITRQAVTDAEFKLSVEKTAFSGITVDTSVWTDYGEGNYYQSGIGRLGSIPGEFDFKQLVPGTYTLTEKDSGSTHTGTHSYTVTVADTGSGYTIDFETEDNYLEFVKMENNEYVKTSEEEAEAYRILNEPSYKSEVEITKAWVGDPVTITKSDDTYAKFPVMNLKTEKPEGKTGKVTILGDNGSGFNKLISDHKTEMIAFEESDTPPDDPESCDLTDYSSTYRNEPNSETGHFYAWWDSDAKKIKWYSDASVIYMPTYCKDLFINCSKLGSTDDNYELDFSKFNFERVTTMHQMIRGCSALKKVNLSGMANTQDLTTTADMFNGCGELLTVDMGNWANAPKLNSVASMFKTCKKLQTANLSSLVADKNTLSAVNGMFTECLVLSNLYLGKSINLKSGAQMNIMFSIGNSTINTAMTKLDLSAWDTSNATNMQQMFEKMKALKTVYVSDKWSTDKVTTSANMFQNCTSIVGDNGTAFNSSYTDKTYARVDKDGQPGYFTYQDAPVVNNAILLAGSMIPMSLSSVAMLGISTISATINNTFVDPTSFGFTEGTTTTTAAAGEADSVTFTTEYQTSDTATKEGDKYKVAVTLTLYKNVIKDGVKTVTKYTYNNDLWAYWTSVENTENDEWILTIPVQDNTDEFYVWEDSISGYTSTATQAEPLVMTDGSITVKNTDSTKPVGSLSITKNVVDANGDNYTISNGCDQIDMTHAETFTYLNLPEGTDYTIEEVIVGAEGYTVYSAVYTGSTEPTSISYGMVPSNSLSGTLNNKTWAYFKNELVGTVPTGVTLMSTVLLVLSAMGITILILSYKKKEKSQT